MVLQMLQKWEEHVRGRRPKGGNRRAKPEMSGGSVVPRPRESNQLQSHETNGHCRSGAREGVPGRAGNLGQRDCCPLEPVQSAQGRSPLGWTGPGWANHWSGRGFQWLHPNTPPAHFSRRQWPPLRAASCSGPMVDTWPKQQQQWSGVQPQEGKGQIEDQAPMQPTKGSGTWAVGASVRGQGHQMER